MTINQRLGTVSNLTTGGTYDLLALGFPDGFPTSQLTFDIGETPRKITGIQKVAQMFLKILFTSVGSDLLHPRLGTLFSSLIINANIIPNDPVLISELSAQIRSSESQTKSILNSSRGDLDGQLESILVIGFDYGVDRVVIYLRLTTLAGSTAQVSVPFPTLDMKLTQI